MGGVAHRGSRVRMKTVTAQDRLKWILLSLLLFGGIFAGSVAGRSSKGTHIPVRAASRAIGARASLSAAVHEQRLPEPAVVGSELFRMPVEPAVIRLMSARFPDMQVSGPPRTELFPPPLLHRPPPVSFIA